MSEPQTTRTQPVELGGIDPSRSTFEAFPLNSIWRSIGNPWFHYRVIRRTAWHVAFLSFEPGNESTGVRHTFSKNEACRLMRPIEKELFPEEFE